MFATFIKQLKAQLKLPLPGEEVQLEMSPLGRTRVRDIPVEEFNPQKSAVLILLFPGKENIDTVLIERPLYQGVHSGQVAFPGGKFDETDKDLMFTALRETQEEIGVPQNKVEIIGNLSDLYIGPSNFLVTPYIGYIDHLPRFVPCDKEVHQIVTYNVLDLNNPTIKSEKLIKLSMGFEVKAPYYNIKGLTVWGATAMMISEFNNIVERAIRLDQTSNV